MTAFMDLIESDEEVVQLMKSLDLRLTMLRTSSANYTTVLPQWLGWYDLTMDCVAKYQAAIATTSYAIHKLYLYTEAKAHS